MVRNIPNEQELVLVRNLQMASFKARNGTEIKSLNSTSTTDITTSNSVVLLHIQIINIYMYDWEESHQKCMKFYLLYMSGQI